MKYFTYTLTESELERLFNKIVKKDCWIWTGATMKNRGYGVFNLRGKTETVHRIMYSHFNGEIPMGVGNGVPVIDHLCNVRACCNPEHLRLTSQRNNSLRGDSPPSINHRKTHCIRGHLLPTEPNEKWGHNRHGRRCLICRRINANKRYKSITKTK